MYKLEVCNSCNIEQLADYTDTSLIFICKQCRELHDWSIQDIQRWTTEETGFPRRA